MKLGALELEIEWNVLATRINDKTCYLCFYYVFLEVYHLLLGCYLNFKVVDNFFVEDLRLKIMIYAIEICML
jgi:hypothetical protein